EFTMIGDFLDRLVREFAEELVARLRQALQQQMLPGRIEQMARDRLREVAVGLLDEQAISEIEHVTAECELVGVSGGAEEQVRLADQIEGKIGEAEVDLEHRRMAAPFSEPLSE